MPTEIDPCTEREKKCARADLCGSFEALGERPCYRGARRPQEVDGYRYVTYRTRGAAHSADRSTRTSKRG